MDNELKKKYGLPTAIALVIGIVIGSGVFFKAEKILTATGGNLPLGILAWAIGGLIMIICAYMFSILATRYAHVNGLVDYAEALVGKRYAYYMGWFTTFIYFPAMTSVLAWVSARYLGVLCGFDITGGPVMVLACLFLVGSYAVNALSPILAGKFQVATTVIKLIPLLLMGIVGTIVGLANGTTIENFTTVVTTVGGGNGPKPEAFLGIDQYTNMPANSAIVGVLMCAVWLTYFYGANLTEGWFGPFCFDSSELPIITLYALYIPMFLNVMRREKELNAFHRYVMPVLSIVCCIFFCVAAVVSHGKAVLYYLIVFAVIMALAIPFYRQGKEKT